MRTNDIRTLFLDYFKSKDHTLVKSDSLIPSNDPTLLFTSAGMVQFKSMYVSKGKLEYVRATSCQKCVRTPDLENVGKTPRHHTFFEMLGNFSFGDYFKKESLAYSWDFITNVLKLPKDSLWASIYEDDNEAFEIWNKEIGLPAERIVRLGKKDNFWGPVGGTGPCGPCSEIYIDFGPSFGCGKKDCKPGCDCDRFEEFWNNVFPCFDAQPDGSFKPLQNRGVDTGMGLERLASILQDTKNNYDIDIIKPLVLEAGKLTNTVYKNDAKKDVMLKVIADHARATTFLIGDGIFPLNEGRGYVLRRIIRRAVRFGKLLGQDLPFMYKLSGNVVEQMKLPYPELDERKEQISRIIKQEEERFLETLNQGMNLLEGFMDKNKGVIPGEEAFKLYDTFGFPLELTIEIAAEKSVKVDEAGFEKAFTVQQEKARSAWKGSGEKEMSGQLAQFAKTEFSGYDSYDAEAKVIGLLKDGKVADSANEGEDVAILLNKSPFYGEMGGQAGDSGIISNDKFTALVISSEKFQQKVTVHKAKIKKGAVKVGDFVKAFIDIPRRKAIMRNHTATHLLHWALGKVLGEHIRQAGSYVGPEYFRFDFNHFKAVSREELDKIENLINEKIIESSNVTVTELPVAEAKKTGAVALFGEKYGDLVRVVSVEGVSKEFCGGTHVKNIGKIGVVKITSESSVASGIRRIEAVSGLGAYKIIKEKEKILNDLSELLKLEDNLIVERISKFAEQIKSLEKEISKLKRGEGVAKTDDVLKEAKEVKGAKIVVQELAGVNPGDLRDIGDKIKDKMKAGVIVLFTKGEEKVSYVCMVTKELSASVKAGVIVKEIAALTEGSGGGRDDMAQGGCKTASVPDMKVLLAKTTEIIEVKL
ncbi:MAG: alanine--tRNA ligase [Candidatus Firestonebacteria bacterium RIFOXYC2_FULL_39_67]|nr:MAG: alanine--tRNA ligase [Candidatus Firestonebacteria bacterium RIFOXYD2_FULL_39_29]OGF54947.1 MAG: alanine--tRNA ligase [Candidatus Firestonebacteria bacterium RIFOXYC2_FULL_39_67]